jgi:hypothetical protein
VYQVATGGGSGFWQAHPRVEPEVRLPLGSHYV